MSYNKNILLYHVPMMDFLFGTPMLTTPASYSHLYGLFMGVCFLGLFTVLKLGAGVMFDSIHSIQGRFRSLLLTTPLACALFYILGLPFLWSFWAILLLVLLATVGEVALISVAQRLELRTKQIASFLFPLHGALFLITYGILRWIEFLYATNYGFGIIMAFTIFVVGKFLAGSLFLTLGRLGTANTLRIIAASLLVLPLLWIGFAQQFQFFYMLTLLVYALLCEILLLRWLVKDSTRMPLILGVSAATHIALSIIVLLLLTQSYLTQTL